MSWESWVWDKNNASDEPGQIIWWLKELLVLAGWVVVASGTGSTGTYDDDGDCIATWADLNNADSWFVIEAPGGQQWSFQHRQGGTSTYRAYWRLKVSVSAGFTGGSPAADQTPSATDEQIMLGGGTDASPSYESVFDPYGGAKNVHMGADSAAPYGFWLVCIRPGYGVRTALGMLPVQGVEEDADLYLYHVANNGGWSTTTLESSSSGPQGYLALGRPAEAWVVIPCPGHVAGAANPHNDLDDPLPILAYRVATLGAPAGRKGWLSWLWWQSPDRADGDTLSVDDDYDRICFGDVVFPWPNSSVTV